MREDQGDLVVTGGDRAWVLGMGASAVIGVASCLALLILEAGAEAALPRKFAYPLMAMGAAGFCVVAAYGVAMRKTGELPERPWKPGRFWWVAGGVLLSFAVYWASRAALGWVSARLVSLEIDRGIVGFAVGFGIFNLLLLAAALWDFGRRRPAP